MRLDALVLVFVTVASSGAVISVAKSVPRARFAAARPFAAQDPFGIPSTTYDAQYASFQPVNSLRAVSMGAFTTFTHPLFPGCSARIKETEFCDSTVK
jgi:hypothetical protein